MQKENFVILTLLIMLVDIVKLLFVPTMDQTYLFRL